jgi:hypothetical protein
MAGCSVDALIYADSKDLMCKRLRLTLKYHGTIRQAGYTQLALLARDDT